MSTQNPSPEIQPTPKPQGDAVGLVSSDLLGFGDETPLTAEWLQAQGFKYVPSSLGREYSDHLELGRLNVWEYNDTGEWFFEDCDRISMKTRGKLRMLASLLGVNLPNTRHEPRPTE